MKNIAFLKSLSFLNALFFFTFLLHISFAYAVEGADQKSACSISDSYDIKLLTDSKIIYLQVNNLCMETPKDIGVVLRNFFNKYPDEFSGIVLDLRQTRGGFASSVASITSIFLPPHKTVAVFRDNIGRGVQIKTGRNYYQEESKADDYLSGLPEALKTKPLAILVGMDTKNAADAIANGLLSNKRGILIGEEFETGFSDDSAINDPFYQSVIKNYPIPSLTPSKTLRHDKRYLQSTNIPKGCTREPYETWENTIINTVLKKAEYPRESRRKGEEGVGMLALYLDVSGTILKVELITSTGSIFLDQAMFTALSDIKLLPLNCSTVEKTLIIGVPFIFTLTN